MVGGRELNIGVDVYPLPVFVAQAISHAFDIVPLFLCPYDAVINVVAC